MSEVIRERLENFRNVMKKYGIDAWIAPTNDFHGSEYIGEHFKVRKYLTGFTGSVGILYGIYQTGCYDLEKDSGYRHCSDRGFYMFSWRIVDYDRQISTGAV